MPIIAMMILIACHWSEAGASTRAQRCDRTLNDVRLPVDPDLHLDVEHALVTYKGVPFGLGPVELQLLRLIIEAPKESILYDDLIIGLWGEREPNDPTARLSALLIRLQNKFRRVDPTFDRLKRRSTLGMYWARADHERTTVGRIGVAKYINEGYADGHVIPLIPREHELLTLLIKRNVVFTATSGMPTDKTFGSTASRLNSKFERVLGQRLIHSGPYGTREFRLNPVLRKPASAALSQF